MNTTEIDQAVVSHEVYADDARMRAVFAELRREDPVHWTEPAGYPPFWTISRHADVCEIGKRSDVFITEALCVESYDEQRRVLEETGGTGKYSRMMIHMNGLDHRGHRGITQTWFMPKNLQRVEPMVNTLAARAVDEMLGHGGRCEFVMDVAVWYPLRLIMLLLGVPEADHPRLLTLTQQIVAPNDPSLQRDTKSYKGPAVKEMMEFFARVHEDRIANPRDDLASVIANSAIDGHPIGRMEALSYYIILSTAGHDTTSSTLSGGLLALLRHPDELARLRADPSLLPLAVDEMLRWVTPVRHFMRTATQDVEIGGRKIAAGDRLLLSYPSANFDEAVFDEPHRFKIDRSPNRHVAFGFGVHACLGQNLSRMELRAFFAELLPRIGEIALDGEPSFIQTTLVGGLKSLPLRYAPARLAA
ncbi:MAG: cytochrome P450 [Burkholderiales bacterium]